MKPDIRKRYTGTKPSLKTTLAEKEKDNFEWYKQCADYYSTNATFHDTKKIEELDALYKLFNNKIDSKLFQKVQNPFNTENEEYKHFPSEIRPFNILRTLIERLVSEYKLRPKGFQIEVLNNDAVDNYKEEVKESILAQMKEIWKAKTEGKEQQTQDPDELDRKLSGSYMDNRAIVGTTALNCLKRESNMDEKLIEGMFHWLISGAVFSYKGIVHDQDVDYEIINPKYFDCAKNEHITYVEDASWACSVRYSPLADIIDRYYEELEDSDIKKLDDLKNISNSRRNNTSNNRGNLEDDIIEELHVVWKAYTKFGILQFIDEMGMPQETEIDETYKLDKEMGDISISWHWSTEVFETTIINQDIYLNKRPIIVQRNRVNRKSSCKLPYNGKYYSDINAPNISIMRLGVPYQILYIIIMHKIENELAMDMGKVMLIPKSAIPTTNGWDEDKFVYYMKSMGIAFIDESKVKPNFNQYTVLNGSRLDIISQLVELASWVERRFEELLGVTPQRKGQTTGSALVGTTQRSIKESYVVTEKMMYSYEEFVEREYIGLLDVSKYAWIDGRKSMYVSSDLRSAILDIDPVTYTDTDFGMIPTNSAKSMEIYEQMKETIQNFASSGATPLSVLNMIDSDSVSELRTKLEEQEAILEKQKQTEQERKIEEIEATKKMQESLQDIKNEFIEKIEILKSQTSIKVAEIQANASVMRNTMVEPVDMDGDGAITESEVEEFAIQRQNMINAVNTKQQEIYQKDRHKAIDTNVELYKEKNKKEIEELKAKTALKNKVSGER